MGLRTMQYRAKLIGAELTYETRPTGGAVVRCSVPIPPASGIWEKYNPNRTSARSTVAAKQAEAV